MIKEIKFKDTDNIRLDIFLKSQLTHISRSRIQKLILSGNVKVDGFFVKPSFILKQNQIISYNDTLKSENVDYLIPELIDLEVLYEDDYIIAINKKAGIVVHPGAGNKNGTILNGLMHRYKDNLSSIDKNRPGVVHRLDKDTSGVILFAKTDFSHYSLGDQFAKRRVKKKYNALVLGASIQNGKIENMLSRDPNNRIRYKVSNNRNGKSSLTRYTVNKKFNLPISLLNVYPHTGRTHQIRVHLSHIGYPILNDLLYGGGIDRTKSYDSKYKAKFLEVFKNITRVALHASSIDFFHPKDGKQFSITAPLPKDFLDTVKMLSDYEG